MSGFDFVARSRVSAAIIVSVSLALVALIAQTGFAGVARYNSPSFALQWAPGDARALAADAELILTADADAAQQARAADRARASIMRDPTLGTPFRVLGFIADGRGDHARAKALMLHAEQLSRRDLATQFWLIDEATARLDMTGALRHYDVALRTSSLAPSVLFPILGKAMDEPEVVDALADTLAAAPPWRGAFLNDAIDKSPAISGLVRLAAQLNRRKHPLDLAQTRQLLSRLTDTKAFDLMGQVRQTLLPASVGAALIVDPGFDADVGFYPLDWSLIDGNGVAARREVGNDQMARADTRLGFRADTGRGGEVAHQLLLLKPGPYRLQWTAGHNATDHLTVPFWSVGCADKGGGILQTFDLTPAPAATEFGIFTVPATGCSGQWLTLSLRASNDPAGVTGWVSRVEITR